jgi:hypothetical protein
MRKSISFSFCMAVALFGPARAHATLGESSDTVASDRKALAATARGTASHVGFSVHEYASDFVTIREYVSDSGIVFAVAWNGMAQPDLGPLLGSYAGDYDRAVRQTPRTQGRRWRHVETGALVVETWGHLRNLQGHAYLPDLLPPGVTPNEIQ